MEPAATGAGPAEARLRSAYRMTAIIALAIGVAVLVYGAVIALVSVAQAPFSGFTKLDEGVESTLILVFYLVAIGGFFAISLLRRALHPRGGPDDVPALTAELQRGAILALALSEVPSILGLVLFLLTGRLVASVPLLFLSLFLLALHFPRWSTWQSFLSGGPTFE